MRRKDFVPALIFFASLLLLCSQTLATKSRLLGMGDLSIMIEDESNMINLWDFARNPAGLLEDEEGSVMRSDMLSELHDTKDIRSAPGQSLSSMVGEGEVLNGLLSATYRKDGDFALGVEGSYFFRESEFEDEKYEAEYPEVLFAFCKRLNSQSLIGADIGYTENTLKTNYKMEQSSDKCFENKRLQAQLGVGRELSEAVMLAALFGFDQNDVDADPYFFQSNSYNYWFSMQSIVRLEQKLRLGLETKFNLRRKDFNPIRSGFENHYFTTLKLRGIYDLADRLSLGVLYSHNELFSGYQYPLEWFSNPYYSEDFAVAHWGVGCSYEFGDKVLAGIEYHFRDFSEPRTYNYISGFKHESLNLGVEGRVSEAWSVRGGFIRAGTNINPVTGMGERYQSTENILTLGSGYQPYGSSLILEFSYQYAFKEFEPWYGDLVREAKRHVLCISFKMAL
jgi:hypothetical protein